MPHAKILISTANLMKVVLSIAGSDNTGGAGIQADIKTCCALGVYAATAITGITAQNSKGVYGVEPVSLSLLEAQIDSIFEVMTPDAVKTGMLPSPEIIEMVASKLKQYNVDNIVVDPVMVATNGGHLVKPGKETLEAFKRYLMPLATLITPNLIEASELAGEDISTMDPRKACELLRTETGAKNVLLKGGHSVNKDMAVDYLLEGETLHTFSFPRIDTENTHGTGCTLSSAIACNLALGYSLKTAMARSRSYVQYAIETAKDLHVMRGPGPLNFFLNDNPELTPNEKNFFQ